MVGIGGAVWPEGPPSDQWLAASAGERGAISAASELRELAGRCEVLVSGAHTEWRAIAFRRDVMYLKRARPPGGVGAAVWPTELCARGILDAAITEIVGSLEKRLQALSSTRMPTL